MDERVAVGGCRCPGAPHPDDWVELEPRPTFPMGTAFHAAIPEAAGDSVVLQGLWARVFIRFGVKRWSFVDDDGSAVDISVESAERLLPWADGGRTVVDAADRLYTAELLRPSLGRTSKSSRGGQMDGSTSPTPATGSTTRKRSPSSSPADGAAGKLSAVPGP